MDTRTHLRDQRHSMFCEFIGSARFWIALVLLAAMLITSNYRFEFTPTVFWSIEALGLIGLAYLLIRLARQKRSPRNGAAKP